MRDRQQRLRRKQRRAEALDHARRH